MSDRDQPPALITCHRDHLFARCRERGYTIAEVLPCVVKRHGDEWTIDTDSPAYPRHRKPPSAPKATGCPRGAGSALKGMLRRIGITASATCSCNARARDMDCKGLQWCRDNVDTISGWLAEQAARRKLPYVEIAGKTLIRLAIRTAERWPEALP